MSPRSREYILELADKVLARILCTTPTFLL